ncbi:tubulin monoglutamylase TTLL4-like isoform X3 [Neocloeon triangulifer]|uniref:tubulin monoglutamylase TTLL4-like isoform X3 n=1 Tax=Neocloeon triangulifer TaxID=2078957 RepID=UPI00286EBE15|nr:tubulin monoglutamylase TTLL4-like isoform X3 [Neocloeon triangulifer]
MAYVKVPAHGCQQHDYPGGGVATCQHISSSCCPSFSGGEGSFAEWRCSQCCVSRPHCSTADSPPPVSPSQAAASTIDGRKNRAGFFGEGEGKCLMESRLMGSSSENREHACAREAFPRAGNSQVLGEIQSSAADELSKASHLLKESAAALDNWPDRQQELEAVRSQLRPLRHHSTFHKQETKRMRTEPLLIAPAASAAATKRPREVSPSMPAVQRLWESNSNIADNESSDIPIDDEYEDEELQTVSDESSDPGSNTPSVVGETLGSISLTDSALSKTSSCSGLTAPSLATKTGNQNEPPLRNSLFSYVPPYVRFQMPIDGAQGEEIGLPAEVKRLLKWKLSPITPLVVRRTLLRSNFRLVKTTNDWAGTWGKHMKSALFTSIKDYQKMNHFPGTFQIGRKDRLWRNLHKLMQKFGKKEFGFMPKTYVLPQDLRLLRQAWEKTCGIEKWIVKPPASARGTGIRVVHKWSQIPKKRPLVVQRYIAQPYLINGSKFDLRLYVFVSSVDPLRIYLYDDGLVRFASVKYSNDMSSLHDRYMHLTNYSINKNSSHYTQNEDADACQGHKWTVKSLWTYLAQQGVNVNELWSRLEDLVVKTIISGESSIAPLIREHVSSRYCCYELFGVDVLLDEHLNPWLLEVNISPSLHSSSPLDQAVKGPMVCNLLNMAGYHIPNKLPSSMQKDFLRNLAPDVKTNQLCIDNRLYYIGLSRDEAAKQLFFTKEAYQREDYLGQILQNLSADDVRHLVQAEDELTQAGGFIRVFPTPYTHRYHQFFEGPRYYNMLFDAWETRYNSNRSPGISLLEDLCKQKYHLNIPALSARAKSSAETESATETALESKALQVPAPSEEPQHAESVLIQSIEESQVLSNFKLSLICCFYSL